MWKDTVKKALIHSASAKINVGRTLITVSGSVITPVAEEAPTLAKQGEASSSSSALLIKSGVPTSSLGPLPPPPLPRPLLALPNGQRTIPVYIIAFNQYTLVKQTVEQVSRFPGFLEPVIVDNASTYPPLVAYYESSECKCRVVRSPRNYGHMVVTYLLWDELPTYFAITDPDLYWPHMDRLPLDFAVRLALLADQQRKVKAGFALSISPLLCFTNPRVRPWECAFWRPLVSTASLKSVGHLFSEEEEVFDAPINTTFAVYNKSRLSPKLSLSPVCNDPTFLSAVRVSGRYTAVHLPWLERGTLELPPSVQEQPSEEVAYYHQQRAQNPPPT